MKKVLSSFVGGIGIGQVVYIALLYLFQRGDQSPQTILLVALFSGLMGVSRQIYELKSWPLALKTALHFSLIACLVTLANLAMGMRFTLSLGNLLGYIGSFAGLYLLLWTLFYLIERRKLNRINERLKESQ